ncbi:MAG: diphosphomevalonate decarboxylase, partial [Saprospiraceae bacterium]
MQDYKNPKLLLSKTDFEPSKVLWRSPSNLAIVKYWGKYGVQLPRNPSVSFTLENAFTETVLGYTPRTSGKEGVQLDFLFHGEMNEPFRLKMVNFLESITDIFPFLNQMDLRVQSANSFPHSAGIASSASSMSALALCLCSVEDELFDSLGDDAAFEKKASFVSRLGSGSACRSIFGTMGLWGEMDGVEGSSNLYALPYADKVHDVFKTFHDDILIASKAEKSVSSR